jgi:hypothetical protein
MIAPTVMALVLLIAFTAGRQILKLALLAFRHSRWHRPSANNSGSASRSQRFVDSVDPVTIGEVWFLVAIVASVAVIIPFWPLISSLFTNDTQALSCVARPTHRAFFLAMTALVVTLALGTHWVFRLLSSRLAAGVRVTLTRWGAVAWILQLILTLGAPWKLLASSNPRGLLDGEPVYIIRERGAELLLYHPRTKTTDSHRLQEIPQFKRLPSSGYLFEDPQAFFRPQPGC